ncbi:MAG: molybdenum cofactor guanylyltransferase [Nitrospirae bacterium]|nr:molybdenum cofactor guanylyltransferase [Nitrospirota bacterium]
MKRDKAWVEVDGEPMIDRVLSVMRMVFSKILIVGWEKTPIPDIPVIPDLVPGKGPIGGIYTALHYLISGRNDGGGLIFPDRRPDPPMGIFAVACDMPYLRPEPMIQMILAASRYDVVLPRVGGRLHPLHAFYGFSCLDPLEDKIRREDFTLYRLWPKARVLEIAESEYRKWDPDLQTLVNMNTPEDLPGSCRNRG